MKRHIVCLTFDFDAQSSWISRELTTPTPLSRGEFGSVGAVRILSLLKKYDLPSTWFIPGVVIGTYPEICENVVEHGHEIGHHGWTHVPPANLSREKELEGLIRGNEAIRKLTGQKARGYRSASFDLSPNSIELLVEQGFLYESSLMGDDYTPYYTRIGDVIQLEEPVQFGQPSSLLEMPISWNNDDYPHFEYVRTATSLIPGLMSASVVLNDWIDDFLYLHENLDWGILTYTFHPLCIGRGHRMMVLERLIKKLIENDAVFLTMEEAAKEYINKH